MLLIKDKIKLQFTVQENYRRKIRIQPDVITISKGEACEFEIFIKPLCTCNIINDQIVINYQKLNSKDNKINQLSIPIKSTDRNINNIISIWINRRKRKLEKDYLELYLKEYLEKILLQLRKWNKFNKQKNQLKNLKNKYQFKIKTKMNILFIFIEQHLFQLKYVW